MLVDCPECATSLEGSPGAEMVCPACMTPFLVPFAARAVRSFDVQPGGDVMLFGLSPYAIREGIYVGRFGPSTRLRHDGARWELVGGYPEFAAVFHLLGADLAPMAGTRKLAGWKRAPDPDPGRADATPSAPQVTLPPTWDAIPSSAPDPRSASFAPRDATPVAPSAPAPATAQLAAHAPSLASGRTPAPPARDATPARSGRLPILALGGLVLLLVAALAFAF